MVLVQIDFLARDKAIGADGGGENPDGRSANCIAGVPMLGDDLVGAVEQSDRSQNGQGVPELFVGSRAAAPQGGSIHARKVVENERGRVDHFDRAARIECKFAAHAACGLADQKAEDGADPLAGPHQAVAHHAMDLGSPGGRLGQDRFEARIHLIP